MTSTPYDKIFNDLDLDFQSQTSYVLMMYIHKAQKFKGQSVQKTEWSE